jgi:diguanylate cyclase (GGDEF)-like protein/PAS domain S-box-containing protein
MTSPHGHGVPLLLLIAGQSSDRPTALEVLAKARDVLRVEWAGTLADGLAKLADHVVSAVLLDLSLPECRDLTAVDELRRIAPNAAILILARTTDQVLARRAVERGASDYVVTDQLDTRSFVQLIAMMFERRAVDEQKFVERERAEVTLNSIGDAVLTTDTLGHVTYLNAEAEVLTGWTRSEAFARPLADVFDVMDVLTGQRAQDPATLAIDHKKKVRLSGSYILVGRDGAETAIEHAAAPICDRLGNILGAVIVFRDVVVSRERSLQMLHLAEHDALTDLPNRLLLNDRLARALAIARRYGRRVAVLFLDCDRFKHVNDTLGHAVGDLVLKSIARRIQSAVRDSDTVSRHGGDEFVVLLSEVDQAEDAGVIARKIIAAVAEPHLVPQHELLLAASIGISLYPEDGLDAQTLISRADTAMYYAKSSRNQVGFYRSDREERHRARAPITVPL